jgi:helicase
MAALLLGTSRDRGRPQGVGPVRAQVVKPPVETRRLYWRKIATPTTVLPSLPPNTDVRVLLPATPAFDHTRERLAADGLEFRSVAHWVEEEIISTVDQDDDLRPLSVMVALTSAGGLHTEWGPRVVDQSAYDARDAFEAIWDAHAEFAEELPHVPAAEVVPGEWLGFLPFDQLNPAQAQAAPAVLDTAEHLVITAPTGAGKTVVGMLAVLRAILAEGRKAAWLVPQRSLTDELDRELEAWRGRGLRVERLSGEYSVDIEKVREADLWVATTEKFEAMCRASSLQTALAEVGCMVVDEIHLLGAAARGPLLEALLTRVRGVDSPVRIVGLSATVSNAGEIAEWLDGELIATTWRPSRLTWQLPMIPASSDRRTDANLRTRVAVDLTMQVTEDGGSVLVFCGTKPNVRATALAVAASRGQNITGVDLDDIDRVHQLCAAVGVGLHYKDWEFKREAETRFRNREWDVLVATTTVAAGVNLPARAVIVRDTRVGLDDVDVATVLQMFGRAGRVGAGEREGWAYLITTENERANWQGALVDGYTVYSQIHDSLPDHVLAEVLQGRITSVEDAEQWWLRTLCHHQGDEDTEPVTDAVEFLLREGYLNDTNRPDHTSGVAVTELGKLTARLMVGTEVGAQLRADLATLTVPDDPDTAEDWLIYTVATLVPELAGAPVAEPLRPTVATIRKAGGRRDLISSTTAVTGLGAATALEPGDLAQAALQLVARSPELFARPNRATAGLPNGTLFPILEQAPRYFGWLAAQGYLGTIHPWIAIVAADLGRRVRWRRCAPPRGAGRLLWMCEHMAGPTATNELVPQLWKAASSRGITAPDWPHATPPRHCQLTPADYTALLRERTTGIELTITDGHVHATNAITGALTTWRGRTTHTMPIAGSASIECPRRHPDESPEAPAGAAVFTKRGDYLTSGGWLADHYTAIQHTNS